MHFFHNEMSLSLVKVLMNYCLYVYCVLYLLAQIYAGPEVNWTDFEVVARMKIGRDFHSEVTWQYRKVTGQIASGFATDTTKIYQTQLCSWSPCCCKQRIINLSIKLYYNRLGQAPVPWNGHVPIRSRSVAIVCSVFHACYSKWPLEHFDDIMIHRRELDVSKHYCMYSHSQY